MDTNDLAFLTMFGMNLLMIALLAVSDRRSIAHKRRAESLQEEVHKLRGEKHAPASR